MSKIKTISCDRNHGKNPNWNWALRCGIHKSFAHIHFPLLLLRLHIIIHNIIPFSLLLFGSAMARCEVPRTAFFYGSPVPVEALAQYEWVVVEAENLPAPAALSASGTIVFAYISVGEAEGWRASTKDLDARWFLGENALWHSRVADLTQPGWKKFLIEQRMAVLWQQGYRAFFLDTLDSYQIPIKDPVSHAPQARALANIIRAMHDRFPGVQLMLNRGFDVLPEIGHLAVGMVVESLFQGWDASTGRYVEIRESDRAWLLGQLREAKERYKLPVTVIDYVDPHEPELAHDTARRIKALGFSPWIATPGLDTLGVEANK
jgi:uncharacterized protein (TIGR01370 family)